MSLVTSLTIQGPGKFAAKCWPSAWEAPRSNREKEFVWHLGALEQG